MQKLTTKEAVIFVLRDKDISKYRLAQTLGIQPIMVDNYMNNTRMGKKTADKFETLYDIEISDVYNNRKPVDGSEASPN